MAENVSSQLRAKKAAATGNAKPGTPTAKAATPKPPGQGPRPQAGAVSTKPKVQAKPKAEPEVEETEEEVVELTAEEKAARKEQRKQEAFAKLKAKAIEKRKANAQARTEAMGELQEELEVGQHVFMTRASYYGCEAVIEGFEEVRGRNLVILQVITTKKGRALEEDKFYIRKVSPKFIQEERPTDPYIKRRASQVTAEAEAEEQDLVEDEVEGALDDEVAEDEGTEVDAEEAEAEGEASEEVGEDEPELEGSDEEDEESWG